MDDVDNVPEIKDHASFIELFNANISRGLVVFVRRDMCPACMLFKATKWRKIVSSDEVTAQLAFVTQGDGMPESWARKYNLVLVPTILTFGRRGIGRDMVNHLDRILENPAEDLVSQLVNFQEREKTFVERLLFTNSLYSHLKKPQVVKLLKERHRSLSTIIQVHPDIGRGSGTRLYYAQLSRNHGFSPFQDRKGLTDNQLLMRQMGRLMVQSTTGQLKERKRKNRTVGQWFYNLLNRGEARTVASALGFKKSGPLQNN